MAEQIIFQHIKNCPACHGKRYIEVNREELPCEDCGGSGSKITLLPLADVMPVDERNIIIRLIDKLASL